MKQCKKQLSSLAMLFLVCLTIVATIIPSTCLAKENDKTVRVAYAIVSGYQEGGEDEYKIGYGYEYLQKLANINNWKYEYVYGSFNELLGKLQNGEVDLMGNLSYTKERAKTINYGTYEQGREVSYLYVNENYNKIDHNDYSTINGKKIGIIAGEIFENEWAKWCKEHNVNCDVVLFNYFEECQKALNNGEIDAMVEGNIKISNNTQNWEVMLDLDSIPFYFGVSKSRPDILKELNEAQDIILQENPFYNEKVQDRYLKSVSLATTKLNKKEKDWLDDNGHSIVFGYLKGFPPLSYQDENGNRRGVAADVLYAMQKRYADENIKIKAVAYNDYTTMFNDLKSGKVSIAWPAYDDYWSAEQSGFAISDQVVNASMMLVYSGDCNDDVTRKIGVISTGSLPKIYAKIYYPNSEIVEYDSYDSAIDGVNKKEVSSVLYVSTTYNVHIIDNKNLQNLNMVVLPENFGISFAISQNNDVLCSIINKGISSYGEAEISRSLIVNSAVENDVTLKEYFEQHPYVGVIIVAILIAIIAGSIVWNIRKALIEKIKSSQKEKELYERISNTDELTGLYNRKMVFKACRELLDKYPDKQFVMAHIDMKHFKLFNTFYGDDIGDKLLCDVANTLRKIAKEYDCYAYGRIEADVFCVFFPYDEKKYIQHVENTLNYLRNYQTDFLIEPAIGLYFVTDKEMPIEAMFNRATLASNEVQPTSPNATVVYDEKIEGKLNERQQIINDMQAAIDEEQFKVYLQPKYSLKSNEIIGAEALVRWVHPTKGMISPAEFIPIFESNGFITTLDKYMWEHVCQLLSKWKKECKQIFPISVNVSRISMYSVSTVDFLKNLVEKYDIEQKYLQLELTESAFVDNPDEMKKQLYALRNAGFTILLDDFGSGYSSLNTLREIPVDVLKLDMKFLSLDANDVRGRTVLSSVIRMSKQLNLVAIAEGVEIQEQADYLKDIGCEYVQGYLFAKPMPVEDYENLLR